MNEKMMMLPMMVLMVMLVIMRVWQGRMMTMRT